MPIELPARFEMTWLTTAEHMTTLEASYRSAPLWRKLLGRYSLPPRFPHLHGVLMPFMRIPVVMIAEGVLTISTDALRFSAMPKRAFGWRVHGVRSDLELVVRREEVESVQDNAWESPAMKYYKIPFTRIRTTQAGLAADFLLCVGSTGPGMRRIRHRSKELYAALVDWTRA